jgi:hypothetical protein
MFLRSERRRDKYGLAVPLYFKTSAAAKISSRCFSIVPEGEESNLAVSLDSD